jgi:hypothetical protein
MSRPLRGAAITALGALVLSACGQTYLDTSATTPPSAVTTTTPAAVDPATPVDDLLAEIELRLLDLDQRIIDGDEPDATLARIEELWAAAEPQVREQALNSVYQFEQALDLARSGVTRKRPADASKGYKLMQQIVDAFTGRPG